MKHYERLVAGEWVRYARFGLVEVVDPGWRRHVGTESKLAHDNSWSEIRSPGADHTVIVDPRSLRKLHPLVRLAMVATP